MSIRKLLKVLVTCVLVMLFLLPSQGKTEAAGSNLFITPSGSTISGCVQSDPCDLPTAMGLVLNNDSLYFTAGTYTGSGGNPVLTIDENINLYGGWDGSMTYPPIVDPNTYVSTLDGEDARQVVAITDGSTAFVEGFTIVHGQAYDGAGVYIFSASPTIQGNIITDNLTIDGGPGYTDGRGGGIYIAGTGTPSILDNVIQDNSSGYGGGYFHTGSSEVLVRSNIFLNNDASGRGGGMIIEYTPDLIISNTFKENSSASDGGAIVVWNADPVISANFFENNTAINATALSLGNNSRPEITNNLFINHQATTVSVEYSTPQFINNTLVRMNAITDQRGITLWGSDDCTPPYCTGGTYRNNIFTGFETGLYAGTSGLVDFSMDYNAYYANTENVHLPTGFTAGSNNVLGDPLFVDKGAGDFHLQGSSPCIDTGDPSGVPPAPDADFDGITRPQGLYVDIGAFEYPDLKTYLPLIVK